MYVKTKKLYLIVIIDGAKLRKKRHFKHIVCYMSFGSGNKKLIVLTFLKSTCGFLSHSEVLA
jgi:hypothetical protein